MRKQKPISENYTVQPSDDTWSLIPAVDGPAAVQAGFSLRIYNQGTVQATFSPQNPQQGEHSISVGSCISLELIPGGLWLVE